MSLDEKIFEKGVHNWILASNVKKSIKKLKKGNKLNFPLGCNAKLRDETTTCGDISFANKIILCDDCTQKLIEKFEKNEKRLDKVFGKGLV